jgi:hypothetical protein
MKAQILVACGMAALAVLLFNGCIIAMGVPDKEAKTRPTLGKQLTDLKQARDSGALTEEEYQTAKKRLIDGH